MAEHTNIAWCDSTFNPWIGCTRVSPGCDHCYAEALMAQRWQRVQWGSGQARQRTSAANWRQPELWNADAFSECAACGWRCSYSGFRNEDGVTECPRCGAHSVPLSTRRRVFCASLADVFDNEVPDQWREDLFALIELTPHLDWLLLTKRIGNAADMTFRARGGHLPLLGNLWLGATVVNHDEYIRDVHKLLDAPASLHFLSVEPMLGPISSTPTTLRRLDWVICGGESGAHARPIAPGWVLSLRLQCKAAGVPFFFKQWGGAHAAAGGCALDGVEVKAWPVHAPAPIE